MAEEKEAPRKLSRKEFVKGAAAVAGAGALASCAPAAAPTTAPQPAPTCPPAEECAPYADPNLPATWDKEADVVVLGLGFAGLCAAIEAGRAGASVLGLEKASATGGGSILSGGATSLAGPTPMQLEAGLTEATPDLMYEDLMRIGFEKNVPEIVRTYAEATREHYDWMLDVGIEITGLSTPAGGSLDWVHRTDPPQVDSVLRPAAEEAGAELLMETPAKRLIADANGVVRGVLAESAGKEINIKANRAVVLTAGGFCWSDPWYEETVPIMANAVKRSAPTNTGDGLVMGRMLGAGTMNMPYVKATFGTHPDPDKSSTRICWNGAIIVNRAGRRVGDESLDYKRLSDFVLPQEGGSVFQIFDQNILDLSAVDTWYGPPSEQVIADCAKADTIEELATIIGVPPEALKATVDRYNGFVDAGEDLEFGRRYLEIPDHGELRKIEVPPFYATETTGAILGTYCGVTFDTACHVTDMYGEIVPRLYAAGEVTGGFHGGGYMTGTSVGKSQVFGRIAGKNAAAEEAWA
jgi:fumarate reductase flavoprotein subunit